ncbi:hypothetical protein TNCV_3241381 [Trichonephila clavipes]|nr:hypothetical protein TNCV_3241381 [Trichonephila clavipes]
MYSPTKYDTVASLQPHDLGQTFLQKWKNAMVQKCYRSHSVIALYLKKPSLHLLDLDLTATAGSDVVQSGRQFSMTFSNICGRISAITRRMLSSNRQAFVAYPHRPMTLHSPTENSLAVLNHKTLEANSQVKT